MSLVAIVTLVLYAILFAYTFKRVLTGNIKAVLFYAVLFFPVYTLFLAINFDLFESAELSKLIQYSKELIQFTALGVLLFGQKEFLHKKWTLSYLDKLFLVFLSLTFLFFLFAIGEASLMNRALYVKNIILIWMFYFFGRNIDIKFKEWNRLFQVIFVIAVFATILVSFEKVIGTHFHSIAGYAKYNLAIRGQEPGGIYGLAWTFEAEGGRPRYGAFFAHPLELSSAMLIVGAASLIYLLSVKYNVNRTKYIVIFSCAIISILFAYSRASLAAFFLMLGFISLMLKYYRLLFIAFIGALFLAVYVVYFAPDEIRFFVIDTLTFQNSSSLTHLVDWLTAIESIISNPEGIGLAMSGNASGVEKELMVGGENQFLVYGVQLGVFGMLIYIGMIWVGIRNSWRAYKYSDDREAGMVAFVAAATKFGLILPLLTANAEVYIYISLVSWWLIGAAETLYQRNRPLRLKTAI